MARRLLILIAAVLAITGASAIASSDKGTVEATDFQTSNDGLGSYQGNATARCDLNERAVGGGVLPTVSNLELAYVRSVGPLDGGGNVPPADGKPAKQWGAHVLSYDSTNRNFEVYAICARASKATAETVTVVADDQELMGKSVSCGKGRTALGGGVLPQGNLFGLAVVASGPLDGSGNPRQTESGDTARGWYGAFANASTQDNRKAKIVVICAPDSKAKIKSKTIETDQAVLASGHAVCGDGKRALGGGFLPLGPLDGWVFHAGGPLDDTTDPSDTGDDSIATQWWVVAENVYRDSAFKTLALCA